MPLLRDPPSDSDSVWAYMVLGRALRIACEFESNCRSLAFVLKVREPQASGQSDEKFFEAVSKAVLGRLVDLNKLIAKRAKLKEEYSTMLHAAKEARNYIAHQAVDELELLAKESGGINRWRSVMESKLHDIAYGKIIVAVLLSQNSAEPTPTAEEIDAYPPKVKSWVLRHDA